jgi:hypothetical protein
MKCQNWSIKTVGVEPYPNNYLFMTMDSTRNIIKGYACAIEHTDYYELQGVNRNGIIYYRNNSYLVCTSSGTAGLAQMRTFTYNLQTKSFTVDTWTDDIYFDTDAGILFNDYYIIGNIYSCGPDDTYWIENGRFAFCYLSDDATSIYDTEYDVGFSTPAFPGILIQTYSNLVRGYNGMDLTATTGDVINGKKFIGKTGITETGAMQVLTYPYPYSEYHNYDYEFYTATAKSNVVRDGESYVLASYQAVPYNKPDTWVLTGNRKMKLGIPYAKLASAIGLTADKIKAGVTILGITGTYTGE